MTLSVVARSIVRILCSEGVRRNDTMTAQQQHLYREPAGNVDMLGLWHRLVLSWRLLRDPRVATWIKGVVPVLAALYVLSPVDLIPDWFLGAGQFDDAGVLVIALVVATRLLPRLAPRHVVAEHLATMGLDDVENPAQQHAGPGHDEVIETTYRYTTARDA